MSDVDPGNNRERVYNAIESLVGAEPIRERLHTAALTLLPLRCEDFRTEPQRELYEQIRGALTEFRGGTIEGHIGTTIRQLDEAAAARIARRILRLLHLVAFPDEAA